MPDPRHGRRADEQKPVSSACTVAPRHTADRCVLAILLISVCSHFRAFSTGDLIGACEVSRREDEEENGPESDEDPLLEDADGESSGEDAY